MVPAVLVTLAAPGKVRVLADRVLAKAPVAQVMAKAPVAVLVRAVATEPVLVMALATVAAATLRRDRINSRASKAARVVKVVKVVKAAAMPVTIPVVMRSLVAAKIPPMPPQAWASVAGNPALVQTTAQTRVQATAPETANLVRLTPETASNLVDPAHRARLSRRQNNNELQLGAAL